MREILLFLIYSIPVAVLLYTLINKKYRRYFFPQKILCSMCFFTLAVYVTVLSGNTLTFMYMLPGFLLCIFGDVLLGMYNKKRNKKTFLAGVFVFLLGHVSFILSMLLLQKISWVDFIFPAVAIVFIAYVTKSTGVTLGKLRPYAFLYTFFVSMLFSKSMHIMITLKTGQAFLLGIGAALFLISDFLIIFLYFYKKRRWSTHGWNITTYYYAMFCLAMSILYAGI